VRPPCDERGLGAAKRAPKGHPSCRSTGGRVSQTIARRAWSYGKRSGEGLCADYAMQARLLRVVRRGILAREAARRCRAWREHLETFLAGEPMPGFVVDELRDYLRCGVLALGAVRFACEHCGNDRLVGISCKGRGFCPRCLGRKMTEMARYWVRAVLPRVRTRQSVLSLPFELRVPLAYRHELTLAVHRMAARAIEDWYRDKGREIGIVDGRTGSITAVDTRDKPAALQPLAAAMRTSTASPRSCRHCLFRRRVSLDVDPDLAFDPPVADISILAPEARRLIVIRRPDVPIQTKVLVELDPRVGRADRLDQLDQAIRDSADLRNLVELAVSLRRHASWNDKVSAARTEAERLLAKWYPPPIEVEKTPAFAKAVVALAGAALYLARQGRAFRSPPYLDAVFVAWLFTRIGRGSPEESLAPRTLRDRVVLVWGPRTVDPDVHPNPDRLAVRPNLDSLRREAGNARSLLEEFYRTPASRSGPLSGNAMLALRGVAPGLADHLGAANTVADALTLATAVSSAPSAPPPPEPALLGVHVGDLFVTRSRLAGYQIADISRIETILANETRERTHTRRTLVETEETTDEEQTRETESDLQQTTREEVRTEQRKDEESELQVSAGGGVSASFGTALSVEAHFDVSSSNSKSLSESLARTTSTETRAARSIVHVRASSGSSAPVRSRRSPRSTGTSSSQRRAAAISRASIAGLKSASRSRCTILGVARSTRSAWRTPARATARRTPRPCRPRRDLR
jgi:hypothetical protein